MSKAKYFVRAPSRIYVYEMSENGRQTDIALLYQYGNSGNAYKLDALDMGERITILLNAFEDIPTGKLAVYVKQYLSAKGTHD